MTIAEPLPDVQLAPSSRLGLAALLAAVVAALAVAATGCVIIGGGRLSGKSYVVNGRRYHILATAEGYKEKGLASWYGEAFHGRKTASGEVYDMYEYSAAHKTLPLQTWVEVRNLATNRKMYLRINDRGPFVDGRIIDLSRAAAEQLGMLRVGVIKVQVTAVPPDKARRLAARQPPPRSRRSPGVASRGTGRNIRR